MFRNRCVLTLRKTCANVSSFSCRWKCRERANSESPYYFVQKCSYFKCLHTSQIWGFWSKQMFRNRACAMPLSTDKSLPRIYLFTKEDCSLCDEAKEVLRPYMHKFILEEVDITIPENQHWYEMYKYDIPVFHIYEEFLFKHRVDLGVLEKALEKYKDGYVPGKPA